MRLERQLVALLPLLADREQPDLGIRDAQDLAAEDGAHRRELEQVLGAGIGIGAGVDEDARTALRGDRHADRRPQHARDAPQLDQPGREHRTGVPGRDDRVGGALRNRAHRRDERAVRLRADGLGRLLVHLDHPGRLTQLQAVRLDPGSAEEDGLDRVASRLQGPCHDLGRAAIAAHRIDRDADHGATARRNGAARPRGACTCRRSHRGDGAAWETRSSRRCSLSPR